MASDQVRVIATVEDFHGRRVVVGVDHANVTISGPAEFDPANINPFLDLLMVARSAAEAQRGKPCHGACCSQIAGGDGP